MTDFENGYREGVKFATDFLRAVAIAAASESGPRKESRHSSPKRLNPSPKPSMIPLRDYGCLSQ